MDPNLSLDELVDKHKIEAPGMAYSRWWEKYQESLQRSPQQVRKYLRRQEQRSRRKKKKLFWDLRYKIIKTSRRKAILYPIIDARELLNRKHRNNRYFDGFEEMKKNFERWELEGRLQGPSLSGNSKSNLRSLLQRSRTGDYRAEEGEFECNEINWSVNDSFRPCAMDHSTPIKRKCLFNDSPNVLLPEPPAPRHSDFKGYKIIIGNLRSSVTTLDVKELFEYIGIITEAKVVRPGTATVTYKYHQDALNAYDEYHGREFDGLPMELSMPMVDADSVDAVDINIVRKVLFGTR